MTQLEKIKTAEMTYKELINTMSKFEDVNNFFDSLGYCYDACLYYICFLIGLECNPIRYAYLDNAISDDYLWEEVYEGIHEIK